MRLFTTPFAPNSLKVRVVLIETGLSADFVDVSADREAYLAVNPLGQVPALELDDGTIVTESLTICQVLDRLADESVLFGLDEHERTEVAMWERRSEMALFNPAIEYGHHVHPMFATMTDQFPQFAATLVPKAAQALDVLERRLSNSPWVAISRFTMADITALLGVMMWIGYGAQSLENRPATAQWFMTALARPSMEPVRELMAWAAANMGGSPTEQ